MNISDKIDKLLLSEENSFGEGILEFLDSKRGALIIALSHSMKSLKKHEDKRPITDYAKAERKLWDKLVKELS